MTAGQRLLIEVNEKRAELRRLALSEDTATEALESAEAELTILENRARIAEGTEAGANGPDRVEASDSEAREMRELEGRVEVRRYIGAAMDGAPVSGAEAEYNAALDMGAGRFPLRLLAPETEARATTNADSGAKQSGWLDRLFSQTAAMHVGVSFRSVGAGVQSYPATTAGASAAQRGRQEDADAAAWTLGVTEVKPTRNAVRAVYSVEDAARLTGLEDALRRDLRMALAEGIDRAVFVGDSGANENAADISGLLGYTGITESTLTQANKVKPDKTIEKLVALIDGRYAASPGDLRIVAAVGANTLWLSTIAAATVENQTLAQFLRASGFSWRVRGDIETATTNGKYGAVIGLARGIEGAAVAPVWGSARLVRDPYSEAASGEVALTLQTLWGFKVCRAANFKTLKFVT